MLGAGKCEACSCWVHFFAPYPRLWLCSCAPVLGICQRLLHHQVSTQRHTLICTLFNSALALCFNSNVSACQSNAGVFQQLMTLQYYAEH